MLQCGMLTVRDKAVSWGTLGIGSHFYVITGKEVSRHLEIYEKQPTRRLAMIQNGKKKKKGIMVSIQVITVLSHLPLCLGVVLLIAY